MAEWWLEYSLALVTILRHVTLRSKPLAFSMLNQFNQLHTWDLEQQKLAITRRNSFHACSTAYIFSCSFSKLSNNVRYANAWKKRENVFPLDGTVRDADDLIELRRESRWWTWLRRLRRSSDSYWWFLHLLMFLGSSTITTVESYYSFVLTDTSPSYRRQDSYLEAVMINVYISGN